ncbi:hypothetical protein NDU88_007229 [Pleurodeles waltl]|uniref:Uncharacterized protein n=1 Tax=Pleurodeles waltl TaxID=8319 RepID=A0AAV7UPI1_PLEWA|nr:hypothetical protein NDU88_007229 [Pleurodeles waltl]
MEPAEWCDRLDGINQTGNGVRWSLFSGKYERLPGEDRQENMRNLRSLFSGKYERLPGEERQENIRNLRRPLKDAPPRDALGPRRARHRPFEAGPGLVSFQETRQQAIELPESLNDTKKQKKRPRKSANKVLGFGPKSLEEIDLLFEEVEAILNSEMDINGALPSKKALPQPKSIQEFFNKKKKAQTTDSVIQIEEAGNLPNTSVTNSPLSQGTSPVEEVESIALPLSLERRLVPNLPCRNRFGPLAEEGDWTRDHENSKAELDIEDVISPPIPIPTIFS